ncbi:MAG: DpnD/PcfM family protein [Clostridia bacterium]|nr:DpnD/PcfM family protein [Clostridia bacterium]
MKREYKVLITETLQKTVIVEAENEQEAHRRISDAWKNSEYILDADSFQGVEFHVMGEAGEDETGKDVERVERKGGDLVE